MSEILQPVCLGMLLSTLYFGGLWLNVRSLLQAPHPHRHLFKGLIVRMALMLGLFFLIFDHASVSINLFNLGLGVCGFLSMRNFMLALIGWRYRSS